MGAEQESSEETIQAPPITIPTHQLTRYLRVRVSVVDHQLQWDVPKTLLGVMPMGARQVMIPVGEVQSIDMGRTVRAVPLIVGIALIAAPWVLLPWWFALPVAIVGLWVAIVALGPQLVVTTRSGKRPSAAVCFGHQLDADLYMDVVKELSAARQS
jgi:hypothetical protein